MGFTRGLSELALVVPNAMELIAFYRDVVRLELESLEVGKWGWLWTGRLGNAHCGLQLLHRIGSGQQVAGTSNWIGSDLVTSFTSSCKADTKPGLGLT